MFRWPFTLDASPIFSTNKLISTPRARRSFAADLITHLKRYGFARVRNHGVALATIRGLFKYVIIESLLMIYSFSVARRFVIARDKVSNTSHILTASSFFQSSTSREA